MWPYIDGQETKWRYNTATDPAADSAHGAFDFYGNPDHRARIWLRPYEPPGESPDKDFPFWLSTGRVLEHWHSGSMTRRIPTLHRAVPNSYVEIHHEDAAALRIGDHDLVRLVSRRGSLEIEARIDYRAQPARGQVFVPFFDEALLVNELTLEFSPAPPPSSFLPRRCARAVMTEARSRPWCGKVTIGSPTTWSSTTWSTRAGWRRRVIRTRVVRDVTARRRRSAWTWRGARNPRAA